MALTITPAAPLDGEAVVPLDLAREYLRRLDQDEDQTIQALRDAAIGWIESYTGKALTARSFVCVSDRPAGRLFLAIAPILQVSDVEIMSSGGVWTAAAANQWFADPFGDVRLLGVPSNAAAVRITLDAGYDDVSIEAPALVSAVLLLLGHLFTNRSTMVIGTTASELPFSVQSLCQPYRTPVIA